MTESMKNLAVVVTGGTRGIGRGIATAFVREGASVLITGRDVSLGSELAEQLSRVGSGRCLFLKSDVNSALESKQMADFALDAFGKIDVLCANAGIFPSKSIPDLTEADIDLILGTNIKGSILSIQACLPGLSLSGRGRVILTSSITGPVTGFPGFSHYGASKSAQLGFMRTAAIELADKGITVNAVLPGTIITEGLAELGEEFLENSARSIPMRRLGSVDDVAHAALFFASEAAGYITGQTLIVDGGQVLPESPQAMGFLG
jgi:3-oxoacyl-[acyl-carrier protein] reductase